MNSRPIIFTVVSLALIWAAVAGVMKLTDSHTSTPEKVVSIMQTTSWSEPGEGDVAQREKHIKSVIKQINLLDFEQRRELRETYDQDAQEFFNKLTAEEKSEFLQATVEQHFKSIMKAFNQMSQEERKRAIEMARVELQSNEVDGQNIQRLKAEDEGVFQNLVEKGLGAYYEDASAETKLDLAPLLEEMQHRLRSLSSKGFNM